MITHNDPLEQKDQILSDEYDYYGEWIEMEGGLTKRSALEALKTSHRYQAKELRARGKVPLSRIEFIFKTATPFNNATAGWKQKWSK